MAEELHLGSIVRLHIRLALPGMQLAATLSRRRPRHPATDALVEALRRSTEALARWRIS